MSIENRQVTIAMDIDVRVRDVIEPLTRDHNDCVELIKAIDDEAGDWDLTYRLYRYFKHQLDELQKSDPSEYEAVLEAADEEQLKDDVS